MPKGEDIDLDIEDSEGDEPIPAKRDIRIFHRKKEEKKEEKDEDFEEDVFV